MRLFRRRTIRIPVVYVPAIWLSPSASSDELAILADIKTILARVACGTQRTLILPTIVDEAGRRLLYFETHPL